ncbi:dTDP-4-amino-4,6-dideoxygalactose transaminase [Aquiflexum balticum DSM 16537]|uniref:dTDP-4-amino-4,6-dideoxygalactose transaminase n=1 Tax=Aquiflexum balticum DSM 16537 TaxID=758820 RepID=A0A1W2HB02_9BACT|nr:DegT/DnrJ/EryC1/StrS family aminotransferase [Aquiflexum balticum]SMD46070.1 dTDP-4-amino-4,6-dideoxygalactose transaminase [Aquiflexum balticum DSM 16537]
MIPVTKPFLPPREEYDRYLDGIWERNWLTNNGPLVNELELRLKEHLGLDHLLFVSNGTIAIQLAIKALGLKGEIITTPFSYVATTTSIIWEGCSPVFVDILPDKFTINPDLIEAAITPNTSAILATHVYGIPCEVEKIQKIAEKHGLKVIYDGAHAFGVQVKGKSIFEYGDISTCSFHATKIFHSIEGGGVFTKDPELLKRMVHLRNFGHDGFEKFNGIGINAKNSEFHAGMGLAVLTHLDRILTIKKEQVRFYKELFKGLKVSFPHTNDVEKYNYAYFPILFPDVTILKKSMKALEDNGIGSRRYFYPGLNNLDYTQGDCPISDNVSERVLCLPLYHSLTKEEQRMIARILLRAQNN